MGEQNDTNGRIDRLLKEAEWKGSVKTVLQMLNTKQGELDDELKELREECYLLKAKYAEQKGRSAVIAGVVALLIGSMIQIIIKLVMK